MTSPRFTNDVGLPRKNRRHSYRPKGSGRHSAFGLSLGSVVAPGPVYGLSAWPDGPSIPLGRVPGGT